MALIKTFVKSRLMKTALAVFFLPTAVAYALGPHECAILVNKRSPDSLALANFYADLRKIPAVNIIHLDLPDHVREAAAGISPDEFRSLIYEPAIKAISDRKLTSHILVWLYSLDFPATVHTAPPMSLTGMTFVRGQPPSGDDIQSGKWLSPIFQGPDRPDGPAAATVSLEQFAMRLTTNMPLPAMMLGWSGSRGMTLEQIQQQLKASASSDGAKPRASVFFEINDNVRSTTRQWQFEPAIKNLAEFGINGLSSAELPKSAPDLMGIMAGRAVLNMGDYGLLRPGSYADHLTSYGAHFHEPSQTKIIEWLKRGAAATAGTVTEPGSTSVPTMLWPKFPSARMFHHYASGATVIESLYQATRSPLQILFIGDALCAPWSEPYGLGLINLSSEGDKAISGEAEFMASILGPAMNPEPAFMFLLNSRPVMLPGKPSARIKLPGKQLADGYHTLRCIAYGNQNLRSQTFSETGFSINNAGRSVALSGYGQGQKVDLYHPLQFGVSAEGEPGDVAIVVQERIVAQKKYEPGVMISLHPILLGAGPVSFQAVAIYAGETAVRSPPLKLQLQALNQPPRIEGITVTTNDAGDRVFTMAARDDEDPVLTPQWLADPTAGDSKPVVSPENNADHLDINREFTGMAAISNRLAAAWDIDQPNQIQEIHATLRLDDAETINPGHQSGIIFNYVDEHNFFYWGLDGHTSAWTLKQMRDGSLQTMLSRGRSIETGRYYRLMVVMIGPQKMALFVNDTLEATADIAFGPGRVGFITGTGKTEFSKLMIAPVSAVHASCREDAFRLIIPADMRIQPSQLYAGARDIQLTTIRPITAD
jgi:hypothetical protein